MPEQVFNPGPLRVLLIDDNPDDRRKRQIRAPVVGPVHKARKHKRAQNPQPEHEPVGVSTRPQLSGRKRKHGDAPAEHQSKLQRKGVATPSRGHFGGDGKPKPAQALRGE